MDLTLKEAVFKLHPDIVFREEDEGAFLFNPQTDTLHCINPVGASVLKLCNGKNRFDRVCRLLEEEYDIDVSPERLQGDVETFLNRLLTLNFVVRLA
jgi:hypothetical protein